MFNRSLTVHNGIDKSLKKTNKEEEALKASLLSTRMMRHDETCGGGRGEGQSRPCPPKRLTVLQEPHHAFPKKARKRTPRKCLFVLGTNNHQTSILQFKLATEKSLGEVSVKRTSISPIK